MKKLPKWYVFICGGLFALALASHLLQVLGGFRGILYYVEATAVILGMGVVGYFLIFTWRKNE